MKTIQTTALRFAIAITASLCACAVLAQSASDVKIEGAWVRATVEGQKSTGSYMKLTAPADMRLSAIATALAGSAEVHEIRMENGVMKMSPVKGGVALPAGQSVELKLGSYHIMLFDLKKVLEKNTTVPLTLSFVNAKGEQSKREILVPVALNTPNSATGMGMNPHGMHQP